MPSASLECLQNVNIVPRGANSLPMHACSDCFGSRLNDVLDHVDDEVKQIRKQVTGGSSMMFQDDVT